MNRLAFRGGVAAAATACGAVAGAASGLTGRSSSSRADRPAIRLWIATGLLAGSALADSAIEHYRGGFRNPGMYGPLAGSAALVTLAAIEARRPGRAAAPTLACMAAIAIGGAGLAFHIYNVGKRPGRFSWHNLFYGAPLGAPAALSLAGLIGLVALRLKRLSHSAIRRLLAGLGAVGIAGTAAEAALLHFRGAFQNPFMWAPVTLPPVTAALLARDVLSNAKGESRAATRTFLRATAALGFVGAGFHVFGVSRAMGGWRNWRQNLLDGPPIPAPPAFSALALVGLTALAA